MVIPPIQMVQSTVIPSLPDATYITPDCLLAYCSTRLQNLDSQMQTQFSNQQNGIQDANTLSKVEQDLKDAFNTIGTDSDGKLNQSVTDSGWNSSDVQKEIDSIKDPNAKATAQRALDAFKNLPSGATFDDLKSEVLDSLDSGQQALSQGQELGMIGLQSLMSQRQTAVQMTTNLVQSLGDQLKGVADNVGK